MLFLIIIILVSVILAISVLFLLLNTRQYYQSSQCTVLSDCQQSCSSSGLVYPIKVLYTYHLFTKGKDQGKSAPSEEIKASLQKVINSGYNIVNLAFYQYDSIDEYSALGHFLSLSEQDRQSIVNDAHSKNVKLFVSAGGAVGSSTLQQGTVEQIGDEILQVVQSNHLDGIDFDVELPSLFSKISDITKYVKTKSPSLYISHAPQSANFQDNKGAPSDYFTVYQNCGDSIDFLNVQFYNQGCTHTSYDEIFNPYRYDCWNLVWISTGKQACKDFGCVIPLNKLVVGKPINGDRYFAGNGYVDPSTLYTFFQQAAQPIDKGGMDWKTGLMIWEYNPDNIEEAADMVKTVFKK